MSSDQSLERTSGQLLDVETEQGDSTSLFASEVVGPIDNPAESRVDSQEVSQEVSQEANQAADQGADQAADQAADQEENQLESPDQVRRMAMDTAMRMLALREHSVAELEQKLCGKGHDSGVVAQVVEELQRLDLQSDDRFVDSFFRGRLTKGHGPVRIRHDLIQKGIDETLVEATLTQQAEFWIDLAEQARCKRFGEALPVGDSSAWTSQARFLAQRGFPSDLIYRVLGSRY